jgi:hypothetical protein
MKQAKIERITNTIRHWQKLLQFATLLGVLVLGILANAPPALAWKPTTHVYLGQQALKDALDDGKVSIYRVDYKNGKVLSKIGDYPVDSNILSALKAYPSQYRAGILGPDAYPDILTGQQVIHPESKLTNIASGSNAWLAYLWALTNTKGNNTLQQKAFVVGYLTHAAGDMYGHTFINNFSGAPFKLTPPEGPENGVKHVLLEGYIDKRLKKTELDSNFFNVSIAGVEDFIYRNMVDAKPGTALDTFLLKKGGGGTEFSVPRIYSTLRARLQADIDAYYAAKADYDRRYDEKIRAAKACKPFDFKCSATVLRAQAAAIQVQKAAYVAANGLIVTYKEYWRADIDRGLKAWPQVSHEVAKALFFNPQRTTKVDDAERILKNYVNNHLISMSGAPDAVGQFAALAGKISDIIAKVIPDFLVAPIRALKNDSYNAIIKSATGMTKEQLKAYLENPQTYFNGVFTKGSGEKVNLQTFNKKYLQINDTGYTNPNESFDYQKFPAAYNTVTMSKLILLNKDGVNKLLADLKSSSTKLNEPNIMLGFIPSLDGSNQWFGGKGSLDPKQPMILAKSCSTYKQVFMQQAGEVACP